MTEWINFFIPFFPDSQAKENFVQRCESLTPDDTNHKAKIMMHQTQRLVSIADELPRLRRKRESLQLLFLMICVEHISKLHDNFTSEGQSKKYVRRFFNTFLSPEDKELLEANFINNAVTPMERLDFGSIVDLLYDVRCDVVHEGKYWLFHFHDGQTPMVNVEPNVTVSLTIDDFKKIVVNGCINAINDKLGP